MAKKFSGLRPPTVVACGNRRKCFSLEKTRSIRFRWRYSHVLKYGFDLRLILAGMLPNAPFLRSDARMEQAIHTRRPIAKDGLIHYSERGVQCLAMNYTQRLAEANLVPSVGSVCDHSYDNALAEKISGLYKADVSWRQRSWPGVSVVEMATLR